MPVSKQTSPIPIAQHALSPPALTFSGKHGRWSGARSPLTKKHVLEFVESAPRAEVTVTTIKAMYCELMKARILRGGVGRCAEIWDHTPRDWKPRLSD